MTTTRRIIEGTWSCSSCDTKDIPGRHKQCPSCGNPREDADNETKFDFGARTAEGGSAAGTVADAEGLELAAAGADWFCVNCQSANRGDRTHCISCGAAREEAPAPAAASTPAPVPPAAATPAAKPPGVKIPFAPPAAPATASSSAPPAASAAPSSQAQTATTSPDAKGKGGCAGCLVLLAMLGAFIGGIWWLFQPEYVTGTVAARQWERSIAREIFAATPRQGWKDELEKTRAAMPRGGTGGTPGVGEIRACVKHFCRPAVPEGRLLGEVVGPEWVRTRTLERFASVDRTGWKDEMPKGQAVVPPAGPPREGATDVQCERRLKREKRCEKRTRTVQCGTERKCTVKDLKNGFAEEVCNDVPKYCDESYEECTEAQYGDWCRYREWRWEKVDERKLEGRDDPPRWPEPFQVSPTLRATQSEEYRVRIAYTDDGERKEHLHRVENGEALEPWGRGDPVALTPGRLWGVNAVDRLGRAPAGVTLADCGDYTKGRPVPAVRERCEADWWDWKPLGAVKEAGGEEPPRWPQVAPGELERIQKSERYLITLEADVDGRTVTGQRTLPDERQFAAWGLGKRARLEVSSDGSFSPDVPLEPVP